MFPYTIIAGASFGAIYWPEHGYQKNSGGYWAFDAFGDIFKAPFEGLVVGAVAAGTAVVWGPFFIGWELLKYTHPDEPKKKY